MALGDSSGDDADDDEPEEEEASWRGDFRCERMIGRRQWGCDKEKKEIINRFFLWFVWFLVGCFGVDLWDGWWCFIDLTVL